MAIQPLFFDIIARDKTAKAFQSIKEQAAGLGSAFRGFGTTMSAAVTAPVVAFGALTLKAAADFEEGMNAVDAAAGGLDLSEFKALRDLAIDLGAKTQYSASEAASAIEMLIKNGLDARDVLDGAADAAVRLAGATGGQLAPAADVVTDVMQQFGKAATELGSVADQVAGTLVASKLGFDDYRLAIGQAGGVAGKVGVEFEDFNAAIAATSASFASGSDAGTSFKTFLQRLVPASDPAAAAIERLGLEFFDAEGNMKSMAEIAEELQVAIAGLSDEQKIGDLSDIFGQDAIRTAIALGEQGAAGIKKYREAIAGVSADEQAAARMKGFNGAMRELSGAIETLQIAIGDSGLLEFATDAAKALTEFVRGLGETNPEILKWGTIVAGLAAVIGPALVALGLLATAIGVIGVPVAIAIAAVAALGAAFYVWRDDIMPIIEAIGSTLADILAPEIRILESVVEGFSALLRGDFSAAAAAFGDAFHHAFDGLKNIAELALSGAASAVNLGVDAIGAAFVRMKDGALAAVEALVNGVTEWMTTRLSAVWEGVKSKLDWVGDQFFGLYDAVVGHSYIPDLVDGVESEMVGRLDGVWSKVATGVEKTKAVFAGMGTTITRGLTDVLKDGKVSFQEFADLGVKILEDMTSRVLTRAFAPLEAGLNSLFAGPQPGVATGAPMNLLAANDNSSGGFGSLFSGIGSLFSGLFAGFFAEGGTMAPGRYGIAGEDGPELVKSGGAPLHISPLRMTADNARAGDGGFVDQRVFHIDARGAQQGVGQEIAAAIGEYDRKVLPHRVPNIVGQSRRSGKLR